MRTEEVFIELLRPVLQGYSIERAGTRDNRACLDYATTQGDGLAAFVKAFWEASKDTIAEVVATDVDEVGRSAAAG